MVYTTNKEQPQGLVTPVKHQRTHQKALLLLVVVRGQTYRASTAATKPVQVRALDKWVPRKNYSSFWDEAALDAS